MYANILFPINAPAFTYIVPEELQADIRVGSRVNAPFKRGHKVGIVAETGKHLVKKPLVCKPLASILDEGPFIQENMLKLIKWVTQYYMAAPGLALKNAVPSAFFSGKKAGTSRITYDAEIKKGKSIELNQEQEAALYEINNAHKGVFLLHGVTGSGKTEVYINAIKSLPENREAIVLVPEIAITAQMVDRFRSSFGDKTAFYHSGLSTGERITQWQKMRKGEVRVVVGVRSAVFAPFRNTGLIVVDEEQEPSYKQFEGLRYNARDVALARAQIEDFKVVLGSATPSLEAYYTARKGKFRYLELKNRVDRKPLPKVEIIDMTKAEKRTFSLSERLLKKLKENVAKGHQSLIMLNRRGYAPYFMCSACGHTYRCPSCSITLIYHKDTQTLNCHYCGSYLNPEPLCPGCRSADVKCLGAGTQRVEEEIRSFVPAISFQRMDRDTTRKKLSHYRIVRQMEERKIDLLLGTQMVAKGHDFPDVTLSAVISADIALNMPDFRTAERAFQLFTQLAGRAGRGDVPGMAYIQTYETGHYVFEYVLNHDYHSFYEKEIKYRKDLLYPPFSKLVRIILSFRSKESGSADVRLISKRIQKIDHNGIEILGPAPAPIEKIRRLWRWHIILKGKNAKALRKQALMILDTVRGVRDLKVDIDVDPVNMM